MSLAGKKIVLGVSGGIAAYKTPELVRRLRDRGADVRVAGFWLSRFRQSA